MGKKCLLMFRILSFSNCDIVNIKYNVKVALVMPPKSAKKEQNSQWLACDNCGVKVIQNKLKQHENSCDTFGVFNESYKTASITPLLPTEIDIKEAPAIYMQRFIFVPETICSLCHFTMGCNLLLQSNGKKHVKSCWAISDKHLDEVYSTSDGEGNLIRHSVRCAI